MVLRCGLPITLGFKVTYSFCIDMFDLNQKRNKHKKKRKEYNTILEEYF